MGKYIRAFNASQRSDRSCQEQSESESQSIFGGGRFVIVDSPLPESPVRKSTSQSTIRARFRARTESDDEEDDGDIDSSPHRFTSPRGTSAPRFSVHRQTNTTSNKKTFDKSSKSTKSLSQPQTDRYSSPKLKEPISKTRAKTPALVYLDEDDEIDDYSPGQSFASEFMLLPVKPANKKGVRDDQSSSSDFIPSPMKKVAKKTRRSTSYRDEEDSSDSEFALAPREVPKRHNANTASSLKRPRTGDGSDVTERGSQKRAKVAESQ
jgi:hypothetical protein